MQKIAEDLSNARRKMLAEMNSGSGITTETLNIIGASLDALQREGDKLDNEIKRQDEMLNTVEKNHKAVKEMHNTAEKNLKAAKEMRKNRLINFFPGIAALFGQ